MNKQDKFKCKHIKCDMDGNYCGINKGKGYNHCVLPYYQENCEYFETTENKQIEEMAKDLRDLENWQTSYEKARILIKRGYHKITKDSITMTKEELIENYRQEHEWASKETAREIFAELFYIASMHHSDIANILAWAKNKVKQYGIEVE